MSTRAHRPNLRSNRLQRTLTVATENEQRQAGEENGAIPHGMRHLILKRQLQSEENDVHLVHQRPIGGMFCVKKSHRNRVSIGFTVLLARKTVRIFEHETPLQRRGRERASDEKRGTIYAPRRNRRTRANGVGEGAGEKQRRANVYGANFVAGSARENKQREEESRRRRRRRRRRSRRTRDANSATTTTTNTNDENENDAKRKSRRRPQTRAHESNERYGEFRRVLSQNIGRR